MDDNILALSEDFQVSPRSILRAKIAHARAIITMIGNDPTADPDDHEYMGILLSEVEDWQDQLVKLDMAEAAE